MNKPCDARCEFDLNLLLGELKLKQNTKTKRHKQTNKDPTQINEPCGARCEFDMNLLHCQLGEIQFCIKPKHTNYNKQKYKGKKNTNKRTLQCSV